MIYLHVPGNSASPSTPLNQVKDLMTLINYWFEVFSPPLTEAFIELIKESKEREAVEDGDKHILEYLISLIAGLNVDDRIKLKNHEFVLETAFKECGLEDEWSIMSKGSTTDTVLWYNIMNYMSTIVMLDMFIILECEMLNAPT